MLFLTSRMTIARISAAIELSRSLVQHTALQTFRSIQTPIEQFFPRIEADVHCARTFPNHPEVFGIVGASPVFIQRPHKRQKE
jgi:hypothetical protein